MISIYILFLIFALARLTKAQMGDGYLTAVYVVNIQIFCKKFMKL